jgi:hypothetical protein
MEIILDPTNINRYIEKGFDHKDWYTTESQALIELLPEFSDLPIIKTFAVTSMTTSIEANVHLAIKALLQIHRNEKFIGYLPNQRMYLNMVKNGINVPGRKIGDFIKALEGDVNAVVVDIWMCRAFGIEHKRVLNDKRNYFRAPSKKEYDAIENFCRAYAYLNNIKARQVQSMIWAGIKREQGVTNNVSWSILLRKKRGCFSFI